MRAALVYSQRNNPIADVRGRVIALKPEYK